MAAATSFSNMDKDHWTGPRGLPSQMQHYNAAKSSWGYTAPEHLTAGKYADGVQYVQMKMHTYQTNPGLANWFGPGSYGCRFHFAAGGSTSFAQGRIQWTEEWTGAALVKTSLMHWFDSGHWPEDGERDLIEQWQKTTTGQGTMHKGIRDPKTGKIVNAQQVRKFDGINTSTRTTFRATFTATKATVEVLHKSNSWVVVATWTDRSYWQPGRSYHVEGALAYSQQIGSSGGARPNDPARGNAVRKISQLKVWSYQACSGKLELMNNSSSSSSGDIHHAIQAWYVIVPVIVVIVAVIVASLLVIVLILRQRSKQQQECEKPALVYSSL